jgi:hypothetical protein
MHTISIFSFTKMKKVSKLLGNRAGKPSESLKAIISINLDIF